MAFVKEYLTKQDKELLGSWKIRKEGKFIDPSIYKSWNVDKEREIYFIFLGGGALEHPCTYALILNKRKVIINVEVRPSADKVCWIIERIIASKELEQHQDDIINIIKEVAAAIYKERKVEFLSIPSIFFIEDEYLND